MLKDLIILKNVVGQKVIYIRMSQSFVTLNDAKLGHQTYPKKVFTKSIN